MTQEKEYINFFNSPIVSKLEIEGVKMYILENRVFYVDVPRMKRITMELIEKGYKIINDNGGGLYYNVYHFHSFADVDPEVRKWASDPNGSENTVSDAIVIGSVGQKILTDFYLKFDSPIKPTKIFFSLEKAITWTEAQRKVHESK